MTVLVLATDELKEELLAQPVSDDISLQWITHPQGSYPGVDACIDLLFENKKERIEWLVRLNASLVIINAVDTTLEEIQSNFIRINGWSTFLARPVAEAVCANEALRVKGEELFRLLGRRTEWVQDVTGLVTPRIIASVINEAFLALEENVSVESEIDTAMRLGTNYPFGPFEWGQKIGFQRIYFLLEALSQKQTRYKPSRLLKERTLV